RISPPALRYDFRWQRLARAGRGRSERSGGSRKTMITRRELLAMAPLAGVARADGKRSGSSIWAVGVWVRSKPTMSTSSTADAVLVLFAWRAIEMGRLLLAMRASGLLAAVHSQL